MTSYTNAGYAHDESNEWDNTMDEIDLNADDTENQAPKIAQSKENEKKINQDTPPQAATQKPRSQSVQIPNETKRRLSARRSLSKAPSLPASSALSPLKFIDFYPSATKRKE